VTGARDPDERAFWPLSPERSSLTRPSERTGPTGEHSPLRVFLDPRSVTAASAHPAAMFPRTTTPPRRSDPAQEERFEVLAGKVRFTIDVKRIIGRWPGHLVLLCVVAAVGVMHSFRRRRTSSFLLR
jgi:hypothetical protein